MKYIEVGIDRDYKYSDDLKGLEFYQYPNFNRYYISRCCFLATVLPMIAVELFGIIYNPVWWLILYIALFLISAVVGLYAEKQLPTLPTGMEVDDFPAPLARFEDWAIIYLLLQLVSLPVLWFSVTTITALYCFEAWFIAVRVLMFINLLSYRRKPCTK